MQYIFIFFIFLFFNACFHVENLKVSQQTKIEVNPYKKLKKTIETIDKYYVYNVKIYELINLTFDSLIYQEHFNQQVINILKNKYTTSSNSKQEVFSKLTQVIEIIIDNTKYSKEETVNLVLKSLLDNLDPYSHYISKKATLQTNPKKTKPFSSELLNEKYLYLRVETFDKNLVNNLKNEIHNARTKIEGIILDLRGNTGGLLNQAIGTVDLFVSKGIILSQRGRDTKNIITYHATSSTTISNLPLVVLVNSKSASSSEIVSGALQDLKRATIIGQKTFGKGTIQILLPISENKTEAIILTIAKYYLPKGRPLEHKITPDIEILKETNTSSKEDVELTCAINFLNSFIPKLYF